MMDDFKPIGKVGPFACFVKRVLPAVYDDALDYQTLLYKLCAKLNEVIESQNTLGDNFDQIVNLYNELKSYVDNYFENLDIQDEINQKLDEMAEDGTLANIINEQIFDDLNQKIDKNASDITNLSESIQNEATAREEGDAATLESAEELNYKSMGWAMLAAQEISNTIKIVKKVPAGKTLKIIGVGDSIMAAASNSLMNTAPFIFQRELYKLGFLSNAKNFAIGGENVFHFISSDWILSDHYSTSNYPWIVTGKTWSEIVADEDPDIIIYQFDQNTLLTADQQSSTKDAWNAVCQKFIANDIHNIFITPMLQTNTPENKNYNEMINAAAEVQRFIAPRNGNVSIIDVNRLYNIAGRGKSYDIPTFYTTTDMDFARTISTRNWRFTCNIDWTKLSTSNPALIQGRQYTDSLNNTEYMQLTIRDENGSHKVYVNFYAPGFNFETVTKEVTGNTLEIVLEDEMLYINGNNAAVQVAVMRPGRFYVSTGTGALSNYKLEYEQEADSGISFTTDQMSKFYINDPGMISGSSINHPSQFMLNGIATAAIKIAAQKLAYHSKFSEFIC